MTTTLSIGELARRTGVSAHTLRYYEASGVLMPAARSAGGCRRYRTTDLEWLEFVMRLKRTGMPLARIKEFAALRARGDATLQARLSLLTAHRECLAAMLEDLSRSAAALDDKIATYRRRLTPMRARREMKQDA